MSQVNCVKCSKTVILEDSVKCYGGCEGFLHFQCAQIKEVVYRKRSPADKQSFKCLKCKQGGSSVGAPSLQDLHELMVQVNFNVAKMQKEVEDIAKSQKFLTDCYDDMKSQLAKFDQLSKDVQAMKNELAVKNATIDMLNTRLAKTEQYSRRVHLEFTGVQEQPREDLEEIIVNIAAEAGVPICKNDIEVCHRLPTRNNKHPRPIIAEFSSRKTRDSLLGNRYRKIITNKTVIGPTSTMDRIYVNESLSPHYKNLLWLAKTTAREKGFAYCWFRRDRIMVKKADGAQVIVIENEEDISRIK